MSEPRDLVHAKASDPSERGQIKRWRSEFPYHWDADELVSRRELLQVAIYTSGALFASTAFIALLGLTQQPLRTAPQPVARAGDVPEGSVVYFAYPHPDDQAMLVHLPGGEYVAYSQRCTHLSCSVYYQSTHERMHCPCHEGVFDPITGEPTAGPPQRRLPRIVLERDGDMLLAVGVDL